MLTDNFKKLKFGQDTYKHPIDKITTRLSIRSLNKAIEVHSNDTYKTLLIRDMVKLLIDNIPDHEFRKYAQNCLPVAVIYSNHYILKEFLNRGLRSAGTWCMFRALWDGNEEMCKILARDQGYILHEEDVLPFLFAASRNNKIQIGDIFLRSDIKNLSAVDMRDDSYLNELVRKMENLVKWSYTKFLYKKHPVFEKIKTCNCPSVTLTDIANDIRDLKLIADKYYDDKIDKILQYVRIYGLLRWGFIEYGGHLQIHCYHDLK